MFKHEVYSYDTRYKNLIYIYKVNHAFAQKCLRHSLPLLLNNVHEIVKEKLISRGAQGFAKYVKLYFYKVTYISTYLYIYIYIYIFTYTYTCTHLMEILVV